jgi:hypothetical protein
MKPTKKQLKEIQEIEKKVAEVCDTKKTTEVTSNDDSISLKDFSSLRDFLAICMSDIDIFLLKDESQENDNDKLYTAEEIRNQLKSTMSKMTSFTFIHPSCYDVDLFKALSNKVLLDSGLSKEYISSL